MSWFILSLLAPLAWAASNVVDKLILTKWIKHPMLEVIFFSVVGAAGSLFIFLFNGFGHISFGLLCVAFAEGIIYLIAELIYYQTAKLEEISRVISLVYLDPLFTAVLAAFILGEIFTPLKYLGIGLLVAGAIIISYKKIQGFKVSKAIWLATLSAFVYAVSNLFTKYLVDNLGFWNAFAYIRLGTLLGALPILYFHGKAFGRFALTEPKKFILVSLNMAMVFLGTFFFTVALSKGYLTLTTSLSATQPFFVLIMVLAIGAFYPQWLKEESGKRIFLQKLAAIILMFVGVLLIT